MCWIGKDSDLRAENITQVCITCQRRSSWKNVSAKRSKTASRIIVGRIGPLGQPSRRRVKLERTSAGQVLRKALDTVTARKLKRRRQIFKGEPYLPSGAHTSKIQWHLRPSFSHSSIKRQPAQYIERVALRGPATRAVLREEVEDIAARFENGGRAKPRFEIFENGGRAKPRFEIRELGKVFVTVSPNPNSTCTWCDRQTKEIEGGNFLAVDVRKVAL